MSAPDRLMPHAELSHDLVKEIADVSIKHDEQMELVRSLGFDTVAELKSALDEARGTEPTWLRKRLARERRKALADLDDEVEELRARLDAANECLTYVLTQAFEPLTEAQREAVCTIGNDNPLEVLRAIQTLTPIFQGDK
jgi:hypothetical protein